MKAKLFESFAQYREEGKLVQRGWFRRKSVYPGVVARLFVFQLAGFLVFNVDGFLVYLMSIADLQ